MKDVPENHIEECVGSECNEYGCTVCDSCNFSFKSLETLEFYDTSGIVRPKITRRLCRVCVETFAGNASEYPSQYRSDVMILVAWGINHLEKVIRETTS